MAACRRCAASLPGRRQLCDDCKASRGKKPTEPATEATADEVPASKVPAGLHKRGRALWLDLDCAAGTAAGELALEACRQADRLDELDRVIAGKGVLQLMKFRLNEPWWDAEGDEHVHVTVGFQSVLAESRMQQATFKDLLKELRTAKAAAPPGAGPARTGPAGTTPSPAAAAPPATGVDQLAARRAGRVQTSP